MTIVNGLVALPREPAPVHADMHIRDGRFASVTRRPGFPVRRPAPMDCVAGSLEVVAGACRDAGMRGTVCFEVLERFRSHAKKVAARLHERFHG